MNVVMKQDNEQRALNDFRDTSRPVVIVCNGPSAKTIKYNRLPDNALIVRMNMFFLESAYFFGKQIDGYFWSVSNDVIHSFLLRNVTDKEYNINVLFTPMTESYKSTQNQLSLLDDTYHSVNHWKVLSKRMEIAYEMMTRPLPTQGLQALATFLLLGFKEIHIIGMDFYQSSGERYYYKIPEIYRHKIKAKDYQPGYEKNMHSFEKDIWFYTLILDIFADAKIYSLSEYSFFSSLAPISPEGNDDNKNIYHKKMASDSGYLRHCEEHELGKFFELALSLITFFVKKISQTKFGQKVFDHLKRRLV